MDKSLKYRVICPFCGKAFDCRKEGFILFGKLVCADCYHKQPFAEL